jgi:acyl-CoA synthetase (AMP-forming)/AMP-acid ligase II
VPAVLTPPNRKLNLAYYQETIDAVLRRCAFDAVISDIEGITLPTRGLSPFDLSELSASAACVPAGRPALEAPLDASFLQFSSGTTGIKRGVLVTDDAVTAQLHAYAAALRLTEDDRILSWLPLYHDMGFIACLNMPLAFGVHAIMMDPIAWVSKPSAWLKAVGTYGATLSWHPNFAYAFMAQRVRESELAGVDLSSLRALVNCSEPVTHESQQAFLERYSSRGLSPSVFKGCYAMAETTFALTHGEPDRADCLDPIGPSDGTRSPSPAGFVSVGQPLPGVELRMVDPATMETVPDRRVGEIWVRSPFNFTGYFNDRESTEKALVDGWYRTGDLGYRSGESLYVAGRLKDVLIVGGVNVFPQDLEDLVSKVDGIQPGRVSAFSVFDPKVQTERIIILAEGSTPDVEAARQATQVIRQQVLAAFQIANFDVRVVPSGWLIKSSAGKMARGANRRKWLEMTEAEHGALMSPVVGAGSAGLASSHLASGTVAR